MSPVRSVTVFGGASPGHAPVHAQAARAFGRALAENGLRLVYGAGGSGIMGALADGALEAGGEVVGIIPSFLMDREVAHKALSEIRVVGSMHERKQVMFDMSQACCALPGGLGTLDETIEYVTWRQLGLHDRPMVLLDVDGYWAPLMALCGAVIDHGFAAPTARALFTLASSPGEAIAALKGAADGEDREGSERF